VKPQAIPSVYKYLPVSAIPGIGSRREALLNKNGIYTLEDLALTPKPIIKNLMAYLASTTKKSLKALTKRLLLLRSRL